LRRLVNSKTSSQSEFCYTKLLAIGTLIMGVSHTSVSIQIRPL
jgi:hypothetical protein